MRVLITGITGFIGANLARRLLEQGHGVFGLMQHIVGRDMASLEEIKDRINLLTCDIRDLHSVRNAIKKAQPDVVFHLAALSPVRLSFENPLGVQDVNYLGAINIAESLMDLYGPEKVRLIVASTAEVYGIQENNRPFTEDLRLEPSSPYAVSKAAMDMYARMLHKVYNFNVVIMRTSNTFGRNYDKSFFTEYIITEMLNNKDIYIGAPDSVRDYLYVDDHVNGYLLAMKSPEARGHVFNIAGGKGYTNKEWVMKIAQILNYPLDKVHFGQYPPGYPYRPIASDQPYLSLDASKARRILGWSQTVPPEEGLTRTVEHWTRKSEEKVLGRKSEQTISKIKEVLDFYENENSNGFSVKRF
jgi:nucleoside-diphosphate-sugar epimerase